MGHGYFAFRLSWVLRELTLACKGVDEDIVWIASQRRVWGLDLVACMTISNHNFEWKN